MLIRGQAADSFLIVILCLVLAGAGAAAVRSTGGSLVRSGTGFIVAPEGYAVTGAHIVTGCSTISVWTRDGAEQTARVVATDAVHDIALLRTDAAFTSHTLLPPISTLMRGEPVLIIGYGVYVDRPRAPVTTRGVYIASETSFAGTRVHIIRARWQNGESGGPVIGSNGGLVGMVLGRDADQPDLGVVLPAKEIEKFLSRQGVSMASGNTPVPSPHDELLAISFLVQCLPEHPMINAIALR